MARDEESAANESTLGHRRHYDEEMDAIRVAFNAGSQHLDAGLVAVASRSAIVDALVQAIWTQVQEADAALKTGVALIAVGGYGRGELFPYSDVDLMFLLDAKINESAVKEPIRRVNQLLWDCGLRVAAMTRTLTECERFDAENVEFTLALFDARAIAGDALTAAKLIEKSVPRVIARERKKIVARLLDVTRSRHAKYGGTLFHLEPNIKECPGGLRDAHVSAWLARLADAGRTADAPSLPPAPEFVEARHFLVLVRAFLHLRHQRDDNTLDWQSQDEAAAASLGEHHPDVDAAYWMRLYFRQARAIERGMAQMIEDALPPRAARKLPLLASFRPTAPAHRGFETIANRITFTATPLGADDPAHNPDVALAIFAAIAADGASLSREAEVRLEDALPRLSANLEDGPKLWRQIEPILTGPFAGRALRAMHALGVLELLLPEFHGIDALVIRDAYHRYTVDEHTFVLIDTLHGLRAGAVKAASGGALRESHFAGILRDLPHPSLLFLAALLHDTGKGHAGTVHALESMRMAQNVLGRLELDTYESGLVLDLIRNHLEMSAALRRDVFDGETVGSFAARVQTPEALRMLTLFTFADIRAVHPDALTPWKAENLWNLYVATVSYLDRNVDEERVALAAESQLREVVESILARHPQRNAAGLEQKIVHFLNGFPRRYLQTRDPDHIRAHVDMAGGLSEESLQLDFRFSTPTSELTLVTRDRPMLFASMAGALAAWGMNIVTADAFSNADGVVVDSFRFTDPFRTLELNESERERFVKSVRDVMAGEVSLEKLLAARRRGRRKTPKVSVETRVDFDSTASTHSTLLQVVAQDTPGLLRALSLAIAQNGCDIQVALIDTEGEMAIDVFYITQTGTDGHGRSGGKLEAVQQESLRRTLLDGVTANAR